jgi:hypothetical protein
MTMTGQKTAAGLSPKEAPESNPQPVSSTFHPQLSAILYSCESWIFYLNNNRLKAKMAGKYLNSRG